ncbi:hypothetical protein K432DRAFT_84862 [Lepidopterella palustris CBS 459.81]|uniref:Uncharacterized protein n=1 Tax=Lepidopterella palustris CBS 459.81 TaxID=1314670 RepID=A0A8E2JDU8_9PEZI|nr:hypothetical protein K432DRAFT_84862 [Lepidopterella palustris CBS 459.81]
MITKDSTRAISPVSSWIDISRKLDASRIAIGAWRVSRRSLELKQSLQTRQMTEPTLRHSPPLHNRGSPASGFETTREVRLHQLQSGLQKKPSRRELPFLCPRPVFVSQSAKRHWPFDLSFIFVSGVSPKGMASELLRDCLHSRVLTQRDDVEGLGKVVDVQKCSTWRVRAARGFYWRWRTYGSDASKTGHVRPRRSIAAWTVYSISSRHSLAQQTALSEKSSISCRILI